MSAHLLPAVRDLLGQHPRAARLSPEQVAGLLWILCYVPDEEDVLPPTPRCTRGRGRRGSLLRALKCPMRARGSQKA